MEQLLECQVPKTGDKFVVTEEVKDTTFTPGTTAFMSYMREPDMDYQDVIRIKMVVVRRGKGGMERLNFNSALIPVFKDPKMLEHDDYLPVGRKYYIHIEKEPKGSPDILKMEALDFLGWACARAINLKYITNSMAKKGAPKLWPSSPSSALNAASRFCEYFENNKTSTITEFADNQDFRELFVNELRVLEAASVKCGIIYHKQVVSAILNSARFMVYTNDNYFEVVDKAKAKKTVLHYEKKSKWLESMTLKPISLKTK